MAVVSNVARYHRRACPAKSHLPYMALDRDARIVRQQALRDPAPGQRPRRRPPPEGQGRAGGAGGRRLVARGGGSGGPHHGAPRLPGPGGLPDRGLRPQGHSSARRAARGPGREGRGQAPQEGAGALPQPGAQLAGVQRARAGGGDGPHHAPPRPPEVRDHRVAPTWTSSSWCGWPPSSTRSRRATPPPTWPACARGSSSSLVSERAHEMVERLGKTLTEEILPALAEKGIRVVGLSGLEEQQRAFLRRYFNAEILPALTPLAIDISRPFPQLANLSLNLAVLLGPVDRRRGRRRRRRAPARRRAGAVGPAPARAPAGRGRQHVRAARGDHPRRAAHVVPGPDHPGVRRVPHRPGRGDGAGRGGRPRLPGGHRGGAAQAAHGPRGAPGGGVGGGGHPARASWSSAWRSRWRTSTAFEYPLDVRAFWPLVELPALEQLREPPLKALPVLEPEDQLDIFGRLARGRGPAAPPVRVVRPRGGPRDRGGQGPGRARHQADPVPHQRRQPRRAGPGRGRGEGQAGHGDRGADGPLRRAVQHPLGAQPGGGGGPRHLRHPGLQDPRQDLPGGAARPPGHRALRPPGHRELQREDRPHLHRLRPHDRGPRHRGGRLGVLQLPHGLLRPAAPEEAGHGPHHAARPHPEAHRAGAPAGPGGPGRGDPGQDELAGGRGD